MYDCRYWLWLSLAFEPGSVKCDKLLHAFDYNPKAIYEADGPSFMPFCNKSPRLLAALTNKNLDRVYKTLEFCERNNVGILTYDDAKYPSPLRRIQGQPTVIYYKGTIPDFSKRLAIGVVGTRTVTAYGTSTAYTISHDLAASDAIVVSGMATGSDTAAHRGALDARGTTVAFLGSGINVVYPKENAPLMDEITENGAVMTDYPLFSPPAGHHFPVRNRLISGICNGILVIEAPKRSGALITAKHALSQGKIIYAIPGRIGELSSEGTNALLSSGAKTVTKAVDILDDFRHLYNIRETKNQSGYSKFSSAPLDDFSTPYKTPVFNPYAQKNSMPQVNNYGSFAPPAHSKAYGNASNASRIQSRPSEMPRGMFGDSADEERARAYMSLSSEERAEPYESDRQSFNQQSIQNSSNTSTPSKSLSTQNYDGLSDDEIQVLKVLECGERMTVESMSALEMPLQNILTTLTLLEIKHRVIQHPGGYFEIYKDRR